MKRNGLDTPIWGAPLRTWLLVVVLVWSLGLYATARASGGWFEVRQTNQRTSMHLVQYLIRGPSFVWSVGGIGTLVPTTGQLSGTVNTLARLYWDNSTTYALEASYDTLRGFEFGVRLGVVW
jgi:hypothetical protein